MGLRISRDSEKIRVTAGYRAENMTLRFIHHCEQVRVAKNLSYAEIARRMGVSRARVNRIFKEAYASTFNTLTLVRLADALEIKFSDAIDPHLADLPSLKPEPKHESAPLGEIVELKVKPARKPSSKRIAVNK